MARPGPAQFALLSTIGFYLKPDYVPVANWHSARQKFGAHPTQPAQAYCAFLADLPADAKERLECRTQTSGTDRRTPTGPGG